MIALGAALSDAFSAKWDLDARQSIDDVLDAAQEWAAGRLPLREAARIGAVADRDGVSISAAQTQCRAALAVSLDDHRRPALMQMLTAIVARQPNVFITTKGWVLGRDDMIVHRITLNEVPV